MLLYLPIPLVLFLVHSFMCLEFAGELHGGGHGATTPAPASGQPSATAAPRSVFNYRMEDQRSRLERTVSAVKFVKEPLNFFHI